MKFGIVINVSREHALVLARQLAEWLDARRVDYVFEAPCRRCWTCWMPR